MLPAEVPEASEIAQRNNIKILIDQPVEQDGRDPFSFLGLSYFLASKSINISVDFSDYAVCQAIMATIEGWVQSLPRQSKSQLYKLLEKIEEPAKNWLDRVAFSALILLASTSFSADDTVAVGLSRAMFWLAVALFVYVAVDILTYLFFHASHMLRPKNLIFLTQGDQDRRRRIDAKRGGLKIAMSFIFLGVIGTIILGIASNYIFSWLAKA